MSARVITESGMHFGPYPDGHCFHLENSKVYQQIGEGVRMAELALLRSPGTSKCVVWIVEAKSSSPRPETQPNFDEFIEQVRQKLTNGLAVTISTCLGRHGEAVEDLPEPFKTVDLSRAGFSLCLIVADHPQEWCVPLHDALKIALMATVRTWALKPTAVTVINAEMAKENGLISGRRATANQNRNGV